MKTYSKLPTINGIELAGRIASEPQINGKRARFTVIRNLGGDTDAAMNYVDLTVNYFSTDGTFPEFLKKGAAVVVSGYFSPADYEKDGKKHHTVSVIVKKDGLKEADLETVKDKEGKEHRRLPSVNNIEFSGRLAKDPEISGKRARFTLLRNFGGEKGVADLVFNLFDENAQFPEFLKSGAAVTVKAYCEPNNWVTKDGEKRHSVDYIVKKGGIAPAELVEVKVDSDKEADTPAEEAVDLGIELV